VSEVKALAIRRKSQRPNLRDAFVALRKKIVFQ